MGLGESVQRGRISSTVTGTIATNLAPLCRRHHRAKTATVWKYERLADGSYWWQGPHGQSALVTRSGALTLP